jgi:predicted Rossmann-fold nucleotide-binding protein
VYCGSNLGTDPAFAASAVDLGRAMAARGIGLVYGGGHVGMMGTLADAVLAAGGEVVADMHQRKARFEQLADGFIALPGGFGTMEELFEMLTWNQLGLVRKPVVLLDVAGFWGPLFAWVDHAVEAGFVRAAHGALAQRATTVDEALDLALAPVPDIPAKWFDQQR